MHRGTPARTKRLAMAVCAVVVVAVMFRTAMAQRSQAPAKTEAAGGGDASLRIELDVKALLNSSLTLADAVAGDVWVIRAQSRSNDGSFGARSGPAPIRAPIRRTPKRAGRDSRGMGAPRPAQVAVRTRPRAQTSESHLLVLPLVITPGAAAVTIDASTVRVQGATFVAWKLSQEPDAQPAAEDGDDAIVQVRPPPGVPTFARKVKIEPNGTLRWKLERKFRGGVLQDTGSGYDLKIDRKRLTIVKLRAGERPVRPQGRVGREATAQYREEVAEYNRNLTRLKKKNAPLIRQWQERLRDLPDEFQMSMPQHVWAVYEVAANARTMVLNSDFLPNWRIEYEHLHELYGSSGNAGRRGADQVQWVVRSMAAVANDDVVFSQRLVALALERSDLLEQARIDDDLYNVVEKMIDSPDEQARDTVIIRLLNGTPTEATTRLIETAVPRMDAALKLEWLRMTIRNEARPREGRDRGRTARAAAPGAGLLQGGFPDPLGRVPGLPGRGFDDRRARPRRALAEADETAGVDHSQLVLDVANNVLADPAGPAPADILYELILYAVDFRDNPDLLTRVADGIDFESLDGSRRDQAIAGVLQHAGTSELASLWLDGRLLDEAAPRSLQQRTLQLLASAFGWHDPFNIAYDSIANVVFGPTKGQDEVPLVPMGAPITIHSVQHNLFRMLQHGDPRISELAWQALPQFALAEGWQSSGRGESEADDPLSVLLTVARWQQIPRRQLVDFLRRQSEQTRTTEALVWLGAKAHPAVAAQAAHALVGSGRPLGEALAAISGADAQQFAMALYRRTTGRETAVPGLMRTNRHRQLADWFGQSVSAGQVPDPGHWAAEFGRPDELLALVVGGDKVLSAAAAAALSASAGGNDEQAQNVVQAMGALEDPTPEDLQLAWDQLRAQIFAQRMDEAIGSYLLTYRVYPANAAQAAAAAGRRPIPRRATVGPRPGAVPPAFGQPGFGPGRFPGGIRVLNQVDVPVDVQPQIDQVLGQVELSVEEQTVFLGNKTVAGSIPDDHLAIVITEPQQLKELADELSSIEVEQTGPFELLPHEITGWRGAFQLDDGRKAELILARVDPVGPVEPVTP